MSTTVPHSVPPRPSRREASSVTAIRCLIVDDHPAIRVGLRELLSDEPDFTVAAAVGSAEEAVAFAQDHPLDVAIIDYQLGGRSGLWASRKLARLAEPPARLIYSAYSDAVLAAACVVAEASGLVSKAALGTELCDRIRQAAAGETHLPMVPPSLAEGMRRRLDTQEQAIFGLMLSGSGPDEVGRTLGIPYGELEAQLWSMLRKLEWLDRGR